MTGKTVGNLAWIDARIQAEGGELDAVADLLRNEAFTLDMKARRELADMLTGKSKVGPKGKANRDLHLYHDVTSFKLERGLKKLPNAELLKIAARYGLNTTDTIDTAIKNGRRIAAEIEAIDRENGED
jgi:hypothetical protein